MVPECFDRYDFVYRMSTLNWRASTGTMTTPPPRPARDPSRPARTEVMKSKLVKKMRLIKLVS